MENKKANSFKDLEVWKKSADVAVLVYDLTSHFPQSELYGIVNQMRRASVSVSSNTAEGFKRLHKKEKLQFYAVASGSLSELESQTEIAYRLRFLSSGECSRLLDTITEVSKMIRGLIKSLSANYYVLSSNSGFTLVELIVAVGLFLTITAVASANFVQTVRTQRQVADLIAAETTASFVIEQMAREIRTGFNFCQGHACSVGELSFANAAGESVGYRIASNSLERGIGGNFQKISGDNVSVRYLTFALRGTAPTDGWSPRITITLGVSAKSGGASGVVARLQTTVSARTPDG